jgi:hypothetical protein
MTGFDDGGGGFCDAPRGVDRDLIAKLERRVARLEKVLADESRAGFSWGRHMVHGDRESIAAVQKLVAGPQLVDESAVEDFPSAY